MKSGGKREILTRTSHRDYNFIDTVVVEIPANDLENPSRSLEVNKIIQLVVRPEYFCKVSG